MQFLVQTGWERDVGKYLPTTLDVCLSVMQASNFMRWKYGDDYAENFEYVGCDRTVASDETQYQRAVEIAKQVLQRRSAYGSKLFVPVGTVEFVTQFFNDIGIPLLPLNVPVCLYDRAHRILGVFTREELTTKFDNGASGYTRLHYKDHTRIKGFRGIWTTTSVIPPAGAAKKLEISIEVDFETEWRVFVYKGNIEDIRNYAGDPFHIPLRSWVMNCVDMFEKSKKAPIAYTLDVGYCKPEWNSMAKHKRSQHSEGWEVVEVHDFFSCGLYGFNPSETYLYMLHAWCYEKINQEIIARYARWSLHENP